MPPFALYGCESVLYHNVTQQQTILLLCRGDLVADGAGNAAEVVENAAHVNILAGFEVHQGHVHGGAARVSGLPGHISAREDGAFVDIGIKNGLHRSVGRVFRPSHKVIHGALRAVGVVDFDFIPFFPELITRFAQRGGGFSGDQGYRLLVSVDARAHEIVVTVVADFQDGVGNGIGEQTETVGHGFKRFLVRNALNRRVRKLFLRRSLRLSAFGKEEDECHQRAENQSFI